MKDALPNRLAILPHTFVYAARVAELFLTVPVRLVVLERSYVDISVAKSVFAEAMLSTHVPLAFVCLPILGQ